MGADAPDEHVASRKSSSTAPRVTVNISSGIYSDDEDAVHERCDTRKQSLIGQVCFCMLPLFPF